MANPEVLLALHKYHVKGVRTPYTKGISPKQADQDLEDDLRAAVGVGEHSIDAVVRLRGTMHIKPDQENVKITPCIAWMKVAAVLFSKLNGITIESVLEEVQKGNGRLEVMSEELSERANAAMALLVEGTRGTRRGAVSVQLEVSDISPEAHERLVYCGSEEGTR